MVVLKIELHAAITGEISEIGRMVICNDGTGAHDIGHYDVRVLSKPPRTARVENYPRLDYSVWRLVLRGLRAAFPEEK